MNTPADPTATGPLSRRYKGYLLIVLLALLSWNFVDRLTLGLVLQEVRADLQMTDTQLGLLTGIAFAIFYSLLGIPIARWADRGNRVTIIAASAAVWSLAVALCGFAQSFGQLLAARISVGIGEAGCMPPAQSLIGDSFSREERPRAAAIYSLGAPLSLLIGYFLGGWLNEWLGWRLTFVAISAPSILLALLAWRTLREPRALALRRAVEARPRRSRPEFLRVIGTLWRIPTFRHLVIGFSVLNFFVTGLLQWQPSFFIRSFGMHTGELGTWFAVVYGAFGVVGTWAGGHWASGRANDEMAHLRVCSLVYLVLGTVTPLVYLSRTPYEAFALIAVTALGYYATFGPAIAALQTLVPSEMRATAFALLYLCVNLIGTGLGPLAVGALSEALRTTYGPESLRYALLIMSPGYVWVAWETWRASRTIRGDINAPASASACVLR